METPKGCTHLHPPTVAQSLVPQACPHLATCLPQLCMPRVPLFLSLCLLKAGVSGGALEISSPTVSLFSLWLLSLFLTTFLSGLLCFA